MRRWVLIGLAVLLLVLARLVIINVLPSLFGDRGVDRWRKARFGLRDVHPPDPIAVHAPETRLEGIPADLYVDGRRIASNPPFVLP